MKRAFALAAAQLSREKTAQNFERPHGLRQFLRCCLSRDQKFVFWRRGVFDSATMTNIRSLAVLLRGDSTVFFAALSYDKTTTRGKNRNTGQCDAGQEGSSCNRGSVAVGARWPRLRFVQRVGLFRNITTHSESSFALFIFFNCVVHPVNSDLVKSFFSCP